MLTTHESRNNDFKLTRIKSMLSKLNFLVIVNKLLTRLNHTKSCGVGTDY